MHLFNNQHTDSEKIASIKTNRIREIPGKKDEGRPCARYSGYDNACVPSPVSVAYSFLPVAEDITTLPPCFLQASLSYRVGSSGYRDKAVEVHVSNKQCANFNAGGVV